MVLHVLYLEKGIGNVLYHLSEKRVVPVEKQMKRSIFCGTCNCGQMVQKFLGISVKARKREYFERYYLFSENIPFEFYPELPKIPFKSYALPVDFIVVAPNNAFQHVLTVLKLIEIQVFLN